MDSAASQSPPPSESVYDANSGSDIAHSGVPPHFGVKHTTKMEAEYMKCNIEEKVEEFRCYLATEVSHT